MEEVVRYIKKLNIFDEYVVLACSYGPDSMVLLDLLQKEKLNIVVANVNHKLRKESDEEEERLKEYCTKNNLIFESTSINHYPKGNIEMHARNFRYKFFEEMLKKYQSKHLFTAHHGDDLVETIMMRLIRGTSFKGYSGFLVQTKVGGYEIIRPLIYVTKNNILDYAEKNHIPYALDNTNKDDSYTRNRIRNHILPLIKEENNNIHKKLIKFSTLISEYEDYFNKETEKLFDRLYTNNRIDLNEFYLLDNLLKKRLLELILYNIYMDDVYLISDKHLKIILDLINSEKQNSFVILPKNIRVTKFYNILEFNSYENISKAYNFVFKDELKLDLGTVSKIRDSDTIKSNNLVRLNSKEIKLPIYVRTRRNGDKIEIKNLKGSKKINDIFIDCKVPAKVRDIYPIVTDAEDTILWIPGLKKSKFDKQKNESYDIILEYQKKGD